MKLHDGITKAYEKKWSMINTFGVQINLTPLVSGEVGEFTEDFNINVSSLSTTDFVNEPIEAFVMNKWYIHNGRESLYRFTLTVKDENQLSLYKKFLKIYKFSKDKYFDDIAMSITIFKDGDWYNEEDVKFLTFTGVMIEGISNLSFSNETENQIAEFTVSFKSTDVEYE